MTLITLTTLVISINTESKIYVNVKLIEDAEQSRSDSGGGGEGGGWLNLKSCKGS